MAMLFSVVYPAGESAIATGYPGTLVVVYQVPRGPEACLLDELAIAPTGERDAFGALYRVVRIAGGPRRPTLRVRLAGAAPAARDAWLDAREAEGWWTGTAPDDPDELWLVRPAPGPARGPVALVDAPPGDLRAAFDRAGLDDDRRELARLGAQLLE